MSHDWLRVRDLEVTAILTARQVRLTTCLCLVLNKSLGAVCMKYLLVVVIGLVLRTQGKWDLGHETRSLSWCEELQEDELFLWKTQDCDRRVIWWTHGWLSRFRNSRSSDFVQFLRSCLSTLSYWNIRFLFSSLRFVADCLGDVSFNVFRRHCVFFFLNCSEFSSYDMKSFLGYAQLLIIFITSPPRSSSLVSRDARSRRRARCLCASLLSSTFLVDTSLPSHERCIIRTRVPYHSCYLLFVSLSHFFLFLETLLLFLLSSASCSWYCSRSGTQVTWGYTLPVLVSDVTLFSTLLFSFTSSLSSISCDIFLEKICTIFVFSIRVIEFVLCTFPFFSILTTLFLFLIPVAFFFSLLWLSSSYLSVSNIFCQSCLSIVSKLTVTSESSHRRFLCEKDIRSSIESSLMTLLHHDVPVSLRQLFSQISTPSRNVIIMCTVLTLSIPYYVFILQSLSIHLILKCKVCAISVKSVLFSLFISDRSSLLTLILS